MINILKVKISLPMLFIICNFSAHARLMFRDSVTIQDAVIAVTMMESTMQVTS